MGIPNTERAALLALLAAELAEEVEVTNEGVCTRAGGINRHWSIYSCFGLEW